MSRNPHLNGCVAAEERRIARQERGADDDDDEDDDDDTASRFVARLLKFLHKGCHAKEKTVRYRVTQCFAEVVSYLGALEYVTKAAFSRAHLTVLHL